MSDFIPFSGGGGPGGGRGGRHGDGGRRNKNNHNNHRRGGGGGRRRGRGRGDGGRFHRGGGVGMPRNHDITHDRIEILGTHSETTLNIAVEGCCHGELDPIYDRLVAHEKQTGQKVDLLICCGDFQSFRNPGDFHSCSMPPKYRRLGSFPRYYAGEKKAPILTLFIGGNHEASQPLRELYYGGWAAPNIYYLGAAGIVRYGGLRIGGISGIYKSHDYEKGHYGKFVSVLLGIDRLRIIFVFFQPVQYLTKNVLIRIGSIRQLQSSKRLPCSKCRYLSNEVLVSLDVPCRYHGFS